MNKDQAKGKIDQVAGLAKRKAGGLVGNTQLEVEGIVQQVKGKVENAWGNAKEAVHHANEEAAVDHESRIQVEMECATVEAEDARKPK